MNRLARCSSKIMKSMPDMPGEPIPPPRLSCGVRWKQENIDRISWHLLMVRTDLTVDLVIQIRQVLWDHWGSDHYEDGNLFSVNRPFLKLLVNMLFQLRSLCHFQKCTNLEMITMYISSLNLIRLWNMF